MRTSVAPSLVSPPAFDGRPVRLRLSALGGAVRAHASAVDQHGAMLEAELPWLRLGTPVSTELEGTAHPGRVSWLGMDVTSGGAARLRIRVDFAAPGGGSRRQRPDQTLRYFGAASDPAQVLAALDAPPAASRDETLRYFTCLDGGDPEVAPPSVIVEPTLPPRRNTSTGVVRVVTLPVASPRRPGLLARSGPRPLAAALVLAASLGALAALAVARAGSAPRPALLPSAPLAREAPRAQLPRSIAIPRMQPEPPPPPVSPPRRRAPKRRRR